MGREGRRRAGGLHLSESCAVGGVGRVVGGFHAQRWTRRWRREVSGAEIIRRIQQLNHVKVFVLAWHLCGRILPRSQWRMCLVLVLTCIAVFDSGTTTLSTTHGRRRKAGCACEPFYEANLRATGWSNPSTSCKLSGGKGAVFYIGSIYIPLLLVSPLLLLDTGGPHATPGDFLVHACIFIGQP